MLTQNLSWCRFACSLLRQGMKQICITTMNTDALVQDPKQVSFGPEWAMMGWINSPMETLVFFFCSLGCKREYPNANYQWYSNGQAGKGSPCCICFDHWRKNSNTRLGGWHEESVLKLSNLLCFCHMLPCLTQAESSGGIYFFVVSKFIICCFAIYLISFFHFLLDINTLTLGYAVIR